MCIAPITVYVGKRGETEAQETSCRECWQCRQQAVNDWVGRNIAEQKTAVATHSVTLTYGRDDGNNVDHLRAALLTYSDVQGYLKRLRANGYPAGYFVTGENGSKKGRAHWHIILHWRKAVPKHVIHENFMEAHWPHGWSFWKEAHKNAVFYNCKYLQKDLADPAAQSHLQMSKKPPLGAAYFRQLAERHVEQGLAPQTLEYGFSDVKMRTPDGRHEQVRFMLRGRSAELYLDHFVTEWERRHPGRAIPQSELVSEHLDGVAREERDAPADKWAHALRDGLRERAAAEIAELIEEPVMAHHLQVESYLLPGEGPGAPERKRLTYHKPEKLMPDGTAILAAAWRYETRPAGHWVRMHWTKGQGWN